MSDFEPRPLHLHTLESLIADLVSGRPVATSGQDFVLTDDRTRSALDWYRKKGANAWSGAVTVQNGEDLVDAILLPPPVIPALPARAANANSRRLRLKKVEIHRFAGVHKFGTPSAAPENYVHEFGSDITLFEGRNGSGKTSLVNAILWALSGEILRPQREPEQTDSDFECWVSPEQEGGEPTSHKLSPLTPMPNISSYRPEQDWVPADTWVELTFVDENGVELPAIRRTQNRSLQGKLKETPADLAVLGVDPIAVRIGTVMPGLLPLINVGSESELGRAVAQLTGLSSLVDLSEHVRRAKTKIEKEFIKAKTADRDRADSDYNTAKGDLEKIILAHPNLKPPKEVPSPSADQNIETTLAEIASHFEEAKGAAFISARDILGEHFDPSKPALLADLERNISRALERVGQPQDLTALSRLHGLRKVDASELDKASEQIGIILAEAQELDALAKNPSSAARTRLYARVASWMADHPDVACNEDHCVVCSGDMKHAVDPLSGQPVKDHLNNAKENAALLSQTLTQWAKTIVGSLMKDLPEALRAELSVDLPDHPCDLLKQAIIGELFGFEPFKGVLSELKSQTEAAFDAVVVQRADLAPPISIQLPKGCGDLEKALRRLDHAISFARWRQSNDGLAREIVVRVLGRPPKDGESAEKLTLTGKLLELESIVKAAKPVSDALIQCGRLQQHLKTRRAAENRLAAYATAVAALANLAALGVLADEQVNQLRLVLRTEAAVWRSRIYLGAFPDTAHKLVDASMGRKGELGLIVETDGVSAPAQHVTNASALRASLVAFYLAFWEYVLKERGGLSPIVLDDPQELLDDENRERFAAALAPLVAAGAQVIVTSYDPRFCGRVARLQVSGGVQHMEVHPATRQQPVVRTVAPLPVIELRKAAFDADRNAEEPAREFAERCREFFEAKLGDMFDEPAHFAWALENPDPTLATFVQRLRPLVRSSPQGMYSAHVFRRFVDHLSLKDGSPVLTLMNKAHHGRRQEIRAAEVDECADDLFELLEIVEQMYEECYRWRRRDAENQHAQVEAPSALPMLEYPNLNLVVCPDLAAFTEYAPATGSQDQFERLDPGLLKNKTIYFLRRANFGFAAPAGALAIIEAIPGPAADRRLVIARHGDAVYARRLVRGAHGSLIALTAEIPDPRKKSPKTVLLPESAVAVHQVVGIIFEHDLQVAPGSEEAVPVDARSIIARAQIAYRVKDESAVPLALEKQIVLGGARVPLEELNRHKDSMVALTLEDGSSVFKRVGAALPGEMSNLWQFESIGGLGSSQVLSVGKSQAGFKKVINARLIFGVLYHG